MYYYYIFKSSALNKLKAKNKTLVDHANRSELNPALYQAQSDYYSHDFLPLDKLSKSKLQQLKTRRKMKVMRGYLKINHHSLSVYNFAKNKCMSFFQAYYQSRYPFLYPFNRYGIENFLPDMNAIIFSKKQCKKKTINSMRKAQSTFNDINVFNDLKAIMGERILLEKIDQACDFLDF